MYKNKLLCASLVSIFGIFTHLHAQENISANIGLSSNYVWRGVTQSDNNFSLSGGLDLNSDSGFYAGTWLASVDYNDDTNFEYDFYAGYQKEFGQFMFDAGIIYYGYQGTEDINLSELYLKSTYQDLSFAVSTQLDNDDGSSFTDSNYYEISYQFALPYEINLQTHVGYYQLFENDNYHDYRMTFAKGDFTFLVSKLVGNKTLEDTLVSLNYSKTFNF